MRKLLAIGLVMALATSLAHAQQSQIQTPNSSKALTYSQALTKAKSGDKPLLVLVTADWCAPCRQLKAATLPALLQRKTFSDFHFAMMDYDKDPITAGKLIGDRGLPQLIMFEKSSGKWLRRTLNGKEGIHSLQGVESFVAKAGTFRIASNEEEGKTKK